MAQYGEYQLEGSKDRRICFRHKSHDLKPRNQVQKATFKANAVLPLLRNTFVSKDALLCKKLYTTYVRQHLEYAIPTWSHYTKADKHTLEKVQKRSTRTSPSLQGLS